MLRKILIVDDVVMNRRMLQKMLGEDYDVWEAADGREALAIMRDLANDLSVVLLDLVMPEVDGYTVLEKMRADPALSNIPVIVTTASTDVDAEMKALTLGANDFIMKPYNPGIIQRRVGNVIKLRETAATVSVLQRDRLTGLYTRETFFEKAAELIRSQPPGYYVMAAFDIDSFKVINDQYGNEKGDEVLRHVARIFEEGFGSVGGLTCRIAADNFALLYPEQYMESETLEKMREEAASPDPDMPDISFSIGRYIISDLSLPVSAMYDRASIAEHSVKGRYDEHVALYDESMREGLLREQEIVNEMEQALETRQFEVWLQPQYNHSTGALIGSEALVRWRHPVRGLVPPGEFIPTFERNGFIYKLDKYVWESSCVLLRKWLDEGRSPLPISVNISRYDVFRDDFIETILGLVKSYRLPVELLRLEITETAFAKSAEQIIRTVKTLIDSGFTVEIDDFGSGYSSLNTLKDVPAQVIKMDMRFLESSQNSDRGGNILESVVRMAKWLGMSVIAEGVEERAQADFLQSIGCNYMQGYLYAHPMPVEEYEALLTLVGKEEKLLTLETVENLDNNSFWDPHSMDTLIFNTYVGGACIFEWHNEKIEMLRANEKYAKIIGGENCTADDALSLHWEDHMDEAAARATREAIESTIESGDDVTYEAAYFNLFGSGETTYLRTTFRAIARTANRHLVYATNVNLTAQRRAEQEALTVYEQMQAVLDNVGSGITAVIVDGESIRYIFVNDRYYEIYGYTKAQYEAEIKSAFELIHPDDRQRIYEAAQEVNEIGKTAAHEYRVIHRSGKVIWVRIVITTRSFQGIDKPVQFAVYTDITAEKQAEEKILMSAAQLRFLNDAAGSLLAETNIDAGIDTVLSKLLDYFGAVRAFIYEIDYERELGFNSYETYAPGVTPYTKLGQVFPVSASRYWMETLQTSNFFHYDDAEPMGEERQEERELNRRVGIKSILAVALRAGGVLVGTMGVDNPSRRMDDYDNLAAIGDYMAALLARRDMTARIESDRETLQNMMNDTPGGFVRLRTLPEGDVAVEYVNETFCRMYGADAEHILSAGAMEPTRIVHPDDAEEVAEAIADMMSTGETCNVQYRLRQEGGGYTPVNMFGRISHDGAGGSFINAYFADLSEREKRELSLRETMPYVLSAIMEYSTDLVFAKDKEFRYICCSPAFVKFTRQKSEQDVIGHTDYEFWTKEEADHFRGDDMRLFEEGKPLIDYIEPIPSDDGIQHYCSTSKYILRDSTGEIIGMYGIGRDVTAQRTAFEQLKLLTNSIPGGLATYEVSPQGVRIIYFNDGFCGMMGYTREEYERITETGITNLTFEEDRSAVMEQVNALIKDDVPIDCTYRIHTKDGGYIWVNSRGSAAERRGDVCLINVVLFDVTDSKLAQQEALVRAEELQLAMSKLGKLICEYDPYTRVLTVPEAFAAQYGLPAAVADVPESLIASGTIEASTLPAYRAFYEAILRGEKSGSVDYRDLRMDGSLRWQHAEFSMVYDPDGKPIKAVIAAEDTTEQHLKFELEQSRPMLGEENLLVHALFNLSTGETLDYAYRDGSIVPIEDRTALHYGEQRIDTLLIDEGERENYRALNDTAALLERFENGETEFSIDYRRRLPSGDIVWVRNIMRMILKPGGNDVLLFDYFYNVEDEKTREQMNATLVNDNYEYVARIYGENRHFVVMVSQAAKDRLLPEKGDDFDIIAGTVVDARVHPDDRDLVLKNVLVEGIKRNLEASGRFQFTFRIMQPDGDIAYKRITQYYLDRQRNIIIMTREDVTELMREEARKSELLEAALAAANEETRVKEREAAAQLSAIMNSVDGGMSAATLTDGKIGYLYINDQYYAMFGYTKEQFHSELPEGLVDIIHLDDLEAVYAGAEESEKTGSARMEFRVRKRDGSWIWVRSISSTSHIEGIDAPVHIALLIDMTKEKEAADALRMSEEQFRIAASIGGQAMARYDIKTGSYYHHDPVLFALGYGETVENVPETFVKSGNIAPEFVADFLEFYEKIKRGESICVLESRMRTDGDGDFRWNRLDAKVIHDADGNPSHAIIVVSDITELREKEAVYKKWQQSLQQRPRDNYTLFRCNLSKDASFDSAEGSLLQIEFSPHATTFDERTHEFSQLLVYPEDRESYCAFLKSDTLIANYYRGVRIKSLEFRELLPDNALRWLRLTVELVEFPNSSDIEAYMMYEDIDENKRDELLNKERAETDPLTGVLNRAAFLQALEHMTDGPNAVGSLALLMVDIDGFKLINDTFGHVTGDQVLVDIASTLRSILRHGDILGRLGGDEFLIGLPDMSDEQAIERKAAQICSMLYRSLSLDVYISASIGIALYPRDGRDFHELYRKMDAALYMVKDHGKNNYAFFRESMYGEYTKLGMPQSAIPSLAAQAKKRRMLIVDDSPANIRMLSKIFEEDFIIETAKDGAEALAHLHDHGAAMSAVLLDLVMPGMDGFAVLEKMRESIEMRSIPVIVVSGMDEHETSLRTIQCGATDYVTKPVNAALLRLRVQSAISKTENDRLRAQNSVLLMSNTETAKYRAALESVKAAIVTFDPAGDVFFYDPSIAGYIAGNFDDRPLWDILIDDGVAAPADVEKMRALANSVANDGDQGDHLCVMLKAPDGAQHLFRMGAKKRASTGGLSDRVILTFIDMVCEL